MKNIEINYLDVSGYEVLYPKTTTENLIDFGEVLYTREEVDGFIAGLSNQVGNLHFAYGTYTGQFTRETIQLDEDVKATEWINVSIGFQPIGLILSAINVPTTLAPNAPYGQTAGWQTSYPMGFYLPWSNCNYNVVEATTLGFRVRNITGGHTDVISPNLAYLNYSYAYLSFG